MKVAHVSTVAFVGIEAREVDVQVHMAATNVENAGRMSVVGLPDKAVAESRERVRAALHAIGLALPPKRITVNLSPADLPKEGSHYDVPIALALLTAMEVLPTLEMASCLAMGELLLDGTIVPVAGVLPAAIKALEMQRTFICPWQSGPEAAWADGLEIIAAPTLLSLVNHLKGLQVLQPPVARMATEPESAPDLRDVKGQEMAKRALEVAAAGGHNLLMLGPPGAGKSMLAARLPGLLPALDPREALEVSMIQSLAGELKNGAIGRRRPFRAPHHSASMAALVGGGMRAKPGEVSLAHLGVLFLDELPEFQRTVLDSLRQPLETGETLVARANAHVRYPSRVQLVTAMNPCRCGYLAEADRACGRAPRCAVDYQSRISGPLLDRIDLHVEVSAVSAKELSLPPPGEGTAEVAARVSAARTLQRKRYEGTRIRANAEADGELLQSVAPLDRQGQALLTKAVETFKLSARGYHRVLRVARTLADLAGEAAIARAHVAEALSYRRLNISA
jgi:magnesium chelatase family protein